MIVGAYKAERNNKHTGYFLCPHFLPEIVNDLQYTYTSEFCEAIVYLATSDKFKQKYVDFWKPYLIRLIESYFRIGVLPQYNCGYENPRISHKKRISWRSIDKSSRYTDSGRYYDQTDLEQRLKKNHFSNIDDVNATIKHHFPEIWNKYN